MLAGRFYRTRLDNGLTIVSEALDHVRSVSIGVWVRAGTRDEKADEHGIAHFVEHCVFKGTDRRNAFEIVNDIESLGGSLDAFTSRDVTCYLIRCLDEHWTTAIDLLADLALHARFKREDVDKERRVVLEEIQSVEDTPEDLIHDLFAQSVWGPHPVGAPILGSPESLKGLDSDILEQFVELNYHPGNMVLSAAGNVDHEQIVELAGRLFKKDGAMVPRPGRRAPTGTERAVRHYPRDINQTHFCLGTTAWPYDHPRQYDLLVADTVLGGGMTSRLFQEIREKRGLAYSVYSYLELLEDTGLFGTYMACDRTRLDGAVDVVWDELTRFKRDGVTPAELESAKAQLRGELILGSESVNRRMSNLARDEIYLQRYDSPQTAIDHIERVTLEGVWEACQALVDTPRMHQITVGPQ
jgi:predicted Zn-dependent peptidase